MKPSLGRLATPPRVRCQATGMSQPDDKQSGAPPITSDPADRSPADGGNMGHADREERGKAPHVDPADKDQPAEGGREEGEAE